MAPQREVSRTEGPRGLVMSADPDLLDTLLRLAAAADCAVLRCWDPAQVRPHWTHAPIVVLDVAAARACATAGLPRRHRIVLATLGEPPEEAWRWAVAVGAEQVVSLPEAESWLVSAFAEARESHDECGATLTVIGGCGGAGASVFAAAVAVTAARSGSPTLLVDCDTLGGGIDLVLGAEDVGGVRWPDLGVAGGRLAASALHTALPAARLGQRDAALSVLSCGRSGGGPSPAAVRAVIGAGRRAGETVVCDLPRHPTDTALAALAATDLVVLVVPADVRACAASARIAAGLAEQTAPVGLVVRGPAPGGVRAEEIAVALDLPLVATMRPEPGLARSLEQGRVPGRARGPLATAATAVLDELRRTTGTPA